jgi:DNA-binding NarL/FixJ family response regulator
VAVLQGLSEKQVAVQLHMKQHTVHWHVKEIYTSLGVHSHAELCAQCHRLKGFGQE